MCCADTAMTITRFIHACKVLHQLNSDPFRLLLAQRPTTMLCNHFFHRVACARIRSAAFVMARRYNVPKQGRRRESEVDRYYAKRPWSLRGLLRSCVV